jgi:hypothetical protein
LCNLAVAQEGAHVRLRLQICCCKGQQHATCATSAGASSLQTSRCFGLQLCSTLLVQTDMLHMPA